MKKTQWYAPLLCLCLLAGCASGGAAPGEATLPDPTPERLSVQPSASKAPVDGAVLEGCRLVDGAASGALLLAGPGEHDVYVLHAEGLTVTLDGAPAAPADLRDGMLLDVAYSGMIQETYPASLSAPTAIHARTEGADDRCGLYLKVLEDLWAVDSGLNSDITELGVDLTGLTDLTPAERSAVAWAFGTAHGILPVTGTLEELIEQGCLTPETRGEQVLYHWEEGCHFSIRGAAESFEAEKWRGPLGAYFFTECMAAEQDGVWSYEIGAEMIS